MISLVVHILTRERPELFRRCLTTVLRDLPGTGRVRVVVNGVGDPSRAVLATVGDPRVSWIEVPREDRVSARNRAFDHGAEDLIVFLDDDCEVPPGYFARILRAFTAEPELAALGGPNLTPPDNTRFQKLSGALMASWFCAPMVRSRYVAKPQAHATERNLILCNLVVRRSALREHRFVSGMPGNEENLFLFDWQRAGARLAYDPELAVWHHRRASPRGFAKQMFGYGRGRATQTLHAPRSLHPAFLVPSLAVATTVFALCGLVPMRTLAILTVSHLAIGLLAAATTQGLRALGLGAALASAPATLVVHAAYGLGFAAELVHKLPRLLINSSQGRFAMMRPRASESP